MQTYDVVVEQIIKRTRTVRVEAEDLEHAEEMAAIASEDSPWPAVGVTVLKQTFEPYPVSVVRVSRS